MNDYLREQWNPGDSAEFEYHCDESPGSADRELFLRSHRTVVVVGEADADGSSANRPDTTAGERAYDGTPRMYEVRFADGAVRTVFEDELLTDRVGFYRPDPPGASA